MNAPNEASSVLYCTDAQNLKEKEAGRDFGSQVVLTNSDARSSASSSTRQRALELRGKLATGQRELQQQQRQLADVTADQERLRKNLKELPPTAAAHKRDLKKFDDQETQIEKFQALIKELQDSESFLANLDVD